MPAGMHTKQIHRMKKQKLSCFKLNIKKNQPGKQRSRLYNVEFTNQKNWEDEVDYGRTALIDLLKLQTTSAITDSQTTCGIPDNNNEAAQASTLFTSLALI